MNAHHLFHWHGKGVKGIVVAQILFGGTGNLRRSESSLKSSGCTPAASNLRRYIGTFSYACLSVHFRRCVCNACNSSTDAVSIGSSFVLVIIVGYSQVDMLKHAPESWRCPDRHRCTWCTMRNDRYADAAHGWQPVPRAPLIPNGWPKAIAPPLGLTCGASSGSPNSRSTPNARAANASFSSITSIS